MTQDPFDEVYHREFHSPEELEKALSKAHRERPMVYFEQFLENQFIEVELEDAIENFSVIARESPLLAEDALIGFQHFLENPPRDIVEYLFVHAGIRPYHNDGFLDERPYNEEETMEFVHQLYARLASIYDEQVNT